MAEGDDKRVHLPLVGQEPVTRAELERALRSSNLLVTSLREELLMLAAQVTLVSKELGRRGVLDEEVMERALPKVVEWVRRREEMPAGYRVELGAPEDKYQTASPDVPCAELMPICLGRCCGFSFALTAQDLDEGVVRWDYARPYRIKQRPGDGRCTHNDPTTHFCGVYEGRPAICRKYDCRKDQRIWIDYERRIPQPLEAMRDYAAGGPPSHDEKVADAAEKAHERQLSLLHEETAVRSLYGKQDE